MIPGQYRIVPGEIELNAGRGTTEIIVVNTGDRPVQVGSHFHFFEVNRALAFPREEAFGMRLDIPAPGEEKPVRLVELGGRKRSYGLNGLSNGTAVRGELPDDVRERLAAWKGGPS
ncbi:unnamed protein product [Rhizoctonia solani]|nr:unnamed protein product [Rhizoctonia solani]